MHRPTEDKDDEVKDEFYNELKSVFDKHLGIISKSCKAILMHSGAWR